MAESANTKLTFKRYEKKYTLTPQQYEAFMNTAKEHLIPDEFHKSLVLSIYYDSDDYDLIRHSIEGPVYKEKLRVRSYGVPEDGDTVFVELKKKYKGIVYKRRVAMKCIEAERWLSGNAAAPEDTQITREIDFFLSQNDVKPKAFIGADRISWVDKDDPELRFTFDHSIKWRSEDLSLTKGSGGENLLEDGCVLMEIKIPGSAPLWLAHLLSEESIFPASYSKYGTCYKKELLSRRFG